MHSGAVLANAPAEVLERHDPRMDGARGDLPRPIGDRSLESCSADGVAYGRPRGLVIDVSTSGMCTPYLDASDNVYNTCGRPEEW